MDLPTPVLFGSSTTLSMIRFKTFSPDNVATAPLYGALYLQHEGGPKIKLVPASKDEFMLEPVPAARIKFVRDESGKIKELRVLNRAGEWETSKRQ
jgi:hypothetical protein